MPDSTFSDGGYIFDGKHAALIEDEIYCIVDLGARILKYDLVRHCFSLIDLPFVYKKDTVLMQNGDGSLGLAGVSGSRLYLWSRMVNPEGGTGWVQQRVIKLKILPKADIFGFAEGAKVFFMSTEAGAFTFELKSGRVRKAGRSRDYCALFLFISFFTPENCHASRPHAAAEVLLAALPWRGVVGRIQYNTTSTSVTAGSTASPSLGARLHDGSAQV
ncbi:hypothetical protein C2845_PM18G03810 [Panicum miliaceum]|uniref:F-box associated domain-containing protein n=1 Tax=Panicum miliaceum TaxID=4540 RepID=A0A3L6PHQ4_PANMI|nr:hypothetical protein C2845_PM18G03810 [Panicum miliaceum]